MDKTLKWNGPYSISEFLCSADNRIHCRSSGVYLWELPDDAGKYGVVYVGKANDLWYRQLEHYWYQIGGAYSLPAEFRACKKDWVLDLSHDDVCATLFDVDKLKILVEENFRYVEKMRLHFALTDETRIVEANLIYQLQPIQNTRGKGSEPKIVIEFDHGNHQWQKKAKT